MHNHKITNNSLQNILLSLLEENGRLSGYEITQIFKSQFDSKFKITEGALYPTLHKLEAGGLLDVEVARVDNRIRKYYKLIEKGTKETANSYIKIKEFFRELELSLTPTFNIIQYEEKIN